MCNGDAVSVIAESGGSFGRFFQTGPTGPTFRKVDYQSRDISIVAISLRKHGQWLEQFSRMGVASGNARPTDVFGVWEKFDYRYLPLQAAPITETSLL